MEGSIAQLTDPTHDRLLRAVTAAIQTDTTLADEFHDRLLLPQLDAVVERLRSDGIDSPDEAAELLLGPVVHRWLLRTGPFEAAWVERHVHRVLAATHDVPARDWGLWLVTAVTTVVVWRTRLHLLWLLGAGALLGAFGWV